MLHHRHSDDPVLDPHPPLDKGYWEFLAGVHQSVARVWAEYYFGLWGKNEASLENLRALGQAAKAATFLKAVFWYLLLGPGLFAFLFAFSVMFKTAHYAWFNYVTHVYSQGGTVILNLDHGGYKFVNLVSFGLYYHKNHHLHPDLFNPAKLPSSANAGWQ